MPVVKFLSLYRWSCLICTMLVGFCTHWRIILLLYHYLNSKIRDDDWSYTHHVICINNQCCSMHQHPGNMIHAPQEHDEKNADGGAIKISAAKAEIFRLLDCFNHRWIAYHRITWFSLAISVTISSAGFHQFLDPRVLVSVSLSFYTKFSVFSCGISFPIDKISTKKFNSVAGPTLGCGAHCHRPCITHHWHWLNCMHSWSPCSSTELMIHYHNAYVTVLLWALLHQLRHCTHYILIRFPGNIA